MANIGEQLLAPESGWKRIDDTDSNIVYNGTWNTQKSSNYYNSSSHYTNENTAYISFKYYGTKIRLLMIYYSTKADGNVIEIDGTKYYFNCSNSMSSGNGTSNLAFEKTGLNKKVHVVKIYAPNASISKSLHIDAIDIDDDGYVLAPDRKIRDSLINPDPTWIRIDDTNEKIIYSKGWENYNSNNLYGNSHHQTNILNESATFYFYGTKLRIISSINFDRTKNIKLTIDNNVYYYSEYSDLTKYKILIFEQCNLKNTFHKVKITNTENKYITLDCIDIDENGKLLSQEEYNKMMSCYIKQGDKYYSFSKDNYDITTKMYKEITLDDINNGLYSCQLTDLTKEVTIGEETFKPIDKFDNFQFVSKYNMPKTIIGRKSKTGMSIASGDIYTKVTSRINSFTLDNTVNNNSYIKMAVSFDNGSTWKTYKDKKFTDLSINIAIKTYENMTTDEKNNWKSAKETILSEGFTPDILSTIDFNTIENLNTIRFAYVLYQDLSTDTCNVDNLSWNFNAKGKFTKLKENEVDISFSNGIISIEPTANFDMILTNYTYNE